MIKNRAVTQSKRDYTRDAIESMKPVTFESEWPVRNFSTDYCATKFFSSRFYTLSFKDIYYSGRTIFCN